MIRGSQQVTQQMRQAGLVVEHDLAATETTGLHKTAQIVLGIGILQRRVVGKEVTGLVHAKEGRSTKSEF